MSLLFSVSPENGIGDSQSPVYTALPLVEFEPRLEGGW